MHTQGRETGFEVSGTVLNSEGFDEGSGARWGWGKKLPALSLLPTPALGSSVGSDSLVPGQQTSPFKHRLPVHILPVLAEPSERLPRPGHMLGSSCRASQVFLCLGSTKTSWWPLWPSHDSRGRTVRSRERAERQGPGGRGGGGAKRPRQETQRRAGAGGGTAAARRAGEVSSNSGFWGPQEWLWSERMKVREEPLLSMLVLACAGVEPGHTGPWPVLGSSW